MSRNVIKSGAVTYLSGDAKVVDASSLLARRLDQAAALSQESLSPDFSDTSEDFEADGDPADALFTEFEESSAVFREVDPSRVLASTVKGSGGQLPTQPMEQEAFEGPTAEQLYASAQQEIDQMYAAAREEIEALKAQALIDGKAQGQAEGYEAGYQEGLSKAREMEQQFKQKKAALDAQYDAMVGELEIRFVDQLTSIYEHVLKISLDGDKGVILHLIDCALRGIESGREFIIHTAPEDYGFVGMQKKRLSANMPGSTVEVVEDASLEKGQCLIETAGGIFDCSVDVEVHELGKRLRMLAHRLEKGE